MPLVDQPPTTMPTKSKIRKRKQKVSDLPNKNIHHDAHSSQHNLSESDRKNSRHDSIHPEHTEKGVQLLSLLKYASLGDDSNSTSNILKLYT